MGIQRKQVDRKVEKRTRKQMANKMGGNDKRRKERRRI